MTKVLIGDVTSNKVQSALKSSANTAKEIMSKIENFVGESSKLLVGEGYNNIRVRLLEYYNGLRNHINICEALSSGVDNTNGIMSAFMEDYSELDDDNLPELKSNLAEAKSHLNWLESCYTVEKYNEVTQQLESYQVRNGTDAEIGAYKEIILEIEKKIHKLEALAPTDNSAYNTISDIETQLVTHILFLSQLQLLTSSGASIQDIAQYKVTVTGINELLDNLFYHLGTIGSLHGISYEEVKMLADKFRFYFGDPVCSECGDHLYFYSQRGYYDEDGNLIEWDGSGIDVAGKGCSITCQAAILSSLYGYEVTPEDIASLIDDEYYDGDSGTTVEKAISKNGGYNYGYSEGHMSTLDNCLDNGGAAKISVKNGDHWVAVLGKLEMGDQTFYIVNDPLSKNPTQDCLWTKGDFESYIGVGNRGNSPKGVSPQVRFYSPYGTTIDSKGNINYGTSL